MILSRAFWKRVGRKVRRTLRRPEEEIQGRILFQEVRRRKQPDSIVIFVSALLGDTTYGMAFIEALHTQDPNKRICVVGNIKQKELLESYREHISELILVDSPKAAKRIAAFNGNSRLAEEGLKCNIIDGNVFYYKKCYQAPNPDAIYQLRTHVYRVGENAPITYHHVRFEEPITAIPNFEELHDRVVILNPYSNSAYESNMGLFAAICTMLKRKGYVVYTNVVGKQETVDGSEELRCSIAELFAIAERIPLVVSIRSGILDFLVSSDVNMFVMYENSSERVKKVNRLTSWERNGKLCELLDNSFLEQKEKVLEALEEFLQTL